MKSEQHHSVTVDGYTRFILTAIAVLLTVLAIGLYSETIDPIRPVRAAVGYEDAAAKEAFEQGRWGTSSARGKKMVAVQHQTNVKIDELIRLFKTGEAKVQLRETAAGSSGGKNAYKRKTK